jgi:cyanophycinase-like exopeptidase
VRAVDRPSRAGKLAPHICGVIACALACTAAPGDDDAHDTPADAGPSGPCAALPAGAVEGAIGALDSAQHASRDTRRLVLMGGGAEVDRASVLFVAAADAHDVLVLRATGAVDSYPPYFADELDVDPAPSSVTTVRLDAPSVGDDGSVLCRVGGAESVWLAGGDQSDYLVRWPAALHVALHEHAGTIGGTSAGAMALAGLAFDALDGSVTSDEALADPASDLVRIAPSPFAAPELAGVVLDTHFVARDREGRLLAFLARALTDPALADLIDHGADEPAAIGVGLDEQSALVIEDGAFTVLADDGHTVSFYRARGPATVVAGSALSLADIARKTLADGDTGAWPLDDAFFADADPVVVVDGAVQ